MAFLDTTYKKKSFTLTTLLLSILLLLLFYIGLSYMDPPIENGISVNFGTTDFGSGKVQPKEKIRSEPLDTPPVEPSKQEVAQQVEEVEEETSEEPVVKEVPSEKVLTQESEESIRIKQAEEAKRKSEIATANAKLKAENEAKQAKAEAARIAKEKRDAEDRAQKEQDAKKKKLDALMGGLNTSDGTASGGEGDDNKAGDKGSPDGDPYAASSYGPGTGTGSGGVGYGLNGRGTPTSKVFEQVCNEAGLVVVEIEVDRNGNVTKARAGVQGTLNTAKCLLDPAEKIALSHKWKPDSKAPQKQVGFVVVNFKLGE